MDKAYSYIRFSSKAQADGRSVARQVATASAYAKEHTLDLQDTSYQDLGISGFRGKNASEGALGRFIEAVDDNKIEQGSYLLVENFDRLSRMPVAYALKQLMTLVEKGINVVTLTDRQVFKKDDLDMTKLMTSLVQMERAHAESKRKSGFLSDVWRAKISKASEKPTKARLPSWLYYNDDKTVIHINEPKAVLIQHIFKLSINGMGRSAIVRQLNEDGIPPIGLNKERWHISYITKILKTRAVLGEYQPYTKNNEGKSVPRCDPILDYYPPILEEPLWLKAQAATALRRQGGTGSLKGGVNKNLFSGLAKCECGASMNLVSKGTGSKGGTYLVCSLARYGNGCKYVGHRYYSIQWVTLIALQKLLTGFSDDKGSRNETLRIEGELGTLKASIDSLADVMERLGPSDAMYIRVQVMEAKKKDLDKELQSIKAVEAAKSEVADIVELSANINDQYHRIRLHQYLKLRLESITIYKDKLHMDITLKEGELIRLTQDTVTKEWTDGHGLTFIVEGTTRWG